MNERDTLQLFSQEVQPSAEPEIQAEPQAPDPAGEFEELIRGKYKEQYQSRVQDTIHKRLRSSRETVEKYQRLTPALKLLSEHYGIAADDVGALAKAVESDDTFYRRQAQQRGLDVNQLRAFRALEQENAQLRYQYRQQAEQATLRQKMGLWAAQAEEAKKLYPDLDMNTECAEPRFRKLLLQGLDVQTAYLVVHRQELLQKAAEAGQQMMANHYMTQTARPSENGTSGQSAAVSRYDVAAMSRADRETIRRRAARGERIRL